MPFSLHQFWLKRPMTGLQFVGAFLIVTSIILAKVPDLVGSNSGGINSVPIAAIGLAIIASSNSGKYSSGMGILRIAKLQLRE